MPKYTLFLLALTVPACSGGASDVVADYELRVTPVTPINQAPFTGLDRMDLIVEPATGAPITYELSGVASGSSPELTGVGALEDATIALQGYANGRMVSFGRSDPLTLVNGSAEARVLVSDVNDFAWFNNLETPVFSGAMASDGGGRFYLFGGNTSGAEVADSGDVTDAIWSIDVAPPDESFTLSQVGTLPATPEGDTIRVAHTATALSAASGQAGKILVAGGMTELFLSGTVNSDAFIWDPETGESTAQIEMVKRRFYQQAVENQAGDVVMIGGFGYARGNAYIAEPTIEIIDTSTATSSTVPGAMYTGALWSAATSLGPDGVLICGGVSTDATEYGASDSCAVLSNSGELSQSATMDDGLFMSSLASLGDGRALLTGGFVGTGITEVDFETSVEATASAWIYDNGTLTPVEDMHFARAGHGSAALPDGRVVIFGGSSASDFGIYPSGDNALACAEIFDPSTDKFTVVGSCSEDDDAATLPSRVTLPNFAADPLYGVLVAGGLNFGSRSLYGKAMDGAALYVSCPDADKC